MRHFLSFSLILTAAVALPAAAQAAPAKGKALKPSPTATVVATATTVKTPTGPKKARWIPWPASLDEARLIKYSINTAYIDPGNGDTEAFSFLDLTVRRKQDEYAVTAESTIRFANTASTNDDVQKLELRTARVSLSETWFNISVGRLDVSDTVTTTRFFGRYPLMGIRRHTGIQLYLPVRFLVGIEDYRKVNSPPTAITLLYLPNIFSSLNADISGQQAFFLGQARVRTTFSNLQTVLLMNYGKSKSNFFENSSINGKGAYALAAELTYSNNYSLYAEYGVQSAAQSNGSTALAYGARIQRIGTWGPFSVDEIVVEMQQNISKSLSNPFTGGNAIYPELALEPKPAWYGKIRTRIKAVYLEAHVTNNQDDYTFARMSPLAINSLLVPFPLGPGLETDESGIPLRSAGTDNIATMVRVGVIF